MRFITVREYVAAQDAYESIMQPIGKAVSEEYAAYKGFESAMLEISKELCLLAEQVSRTNKSLELCVDEVKGFREDIRVRAAEREGRSGASLYWSGDGIAQG